MIIKKRVARKGIPANTNIDFGVANKIIKKIDRKILETVSGIDSAKYKCIFDKFLFCGLFLKKFI